MAIDSERRKILVPKRTWLQRNPRLFVVVFTTTALLSFFSKPLYDAFVDGGSVPSPNKK
jgi:hypothetical protein